MLECGLVVVMKKKRKYNSYQRKVAPAADNLKPLGMAHSLKRVYPNKFQKVDLPAIGISHHLCIH